MVREIFGKKLGMTQVFGQEGGIDAVTVVEAGPCRVLETKKYPAKKKALIGYKEIKKEQHKKKPASGYFKKLKSPYFRYLKEVDILKEGDLKNGADLGVEIFEENEVVSIAGISKGKGFQGGMRRHNWRGQPGSHGSTSHRRIGSVGASADPSKIVKGLPMPGHTGARKVTTKGLSILKVDKDKGLLFIKGNCPGAKNSLLVIKKYKAEAKVKDEG